MPCSPTNAASSISAVGAERPPRTPPASRPTCTSHPTSPIAVQIEQHAGERAQRGQRRAQRGHRGRAGAGRPAAAWSPPRSARRARPTAARARTRRRARSRSASSRCRRRSPRTTSIRSANGTATSAAHPSRAIGGAPSVRCSCERVVRISAASGTASSTSGWMRRVPDTSRPGSSTIAVSSVPTACRNVSVTRLASTPTRPRGSSSSGVITAITSPAASTTPADTRRGDGGGDDPGQREPLADDPGELRRLRVHAPEPPARRRGGSSSGGRRRRVAHARRAEAASAGGDSGRGRPAPSRAAGRRRRAPPARRRRAAVPRSLGGWAAGGPAAQPSGRRAGGASTRYSSRRAPQAEQNRARGLSRSPQFGQKLVSATRSPVASVAPYGYHLRPMEAACGS